MQHKVHKAYTCTCVHSTHISYSTYVHICTYTIIPIHYGRLHMHTSAYTQGKGMCILTPSYVFACSYTCTYIYTYCNKVLQHVLPSFRAASSIEICSFNFLILIRYSCFWCFYRRSQFTASSPHQVHMNTYNTHIPIPVCVVSDENTLSTLFLCSRTLYVKILAY